MRTTINIDDAILRDIKVIQKRERRPMGAVISGLLADALARRRPSRSRPPFCWTSRPMKSLVDLTNKEAVDAAMDADRS
jgi:hypothetical protein